MAGCSLMTLIMKQRRVVMTVTQEVWKEVMMFMDEALLWGIHT